MIDYPVLQYFGHIQQHRIDVRNRANQRLLDARGPTEAAVETPAPWIQAVQGVGSRGRGLPDPDAEESVAQTLRDVAIMQRVQNATLYDDQARRQQQLARLMATQMVERRHYHGPDDATTAAMAMGQGRDTCSICMDNYIDTDPVTRVECFHLFHQNCLDTYVATMTAWATTEASCPLCRGGLDNGTVMFYSEAREQVQPQDFESATSISLDNSIASSVDMNLFVPCWPATGAYHTSTQLTDGRLSIIVDPGAWTNLVAQVLARKVAQRALANGFEPRQAQMDQTLQVAGVGRGTQDCHWKMEVPIAIPQDGKAKLHRLSSPIVEGTGANLPGLLGLDSIQRNRGILDTGERKRLIFPGPGEIQMILPPGTIQIPFEKAPSGHLVMVIDAYEQLKPAKGGLPSADSQLNLVAEQSTPAINVTPIAAAANEPPAARPLNLHSRLTETPVATEAQTATLGSTSSPDCSPIDTGRPQPQHCKTMLVFEEHSVLTERLTKMG